MNENLKLYLKNHIFIKFINLFTYINEYLKKYIIRFLIIF